MATNVEPPRPGAVGGAAAAGTAPGSTTTTPGVSKKEPIGKRWGEGRESPARELPGKSFCHWRVLHFTRHSESCEFASKFGLRWSRAVGIFRCRGNSLGVQREMGSLRRQSPLCYLTSRAPNAIAKTANRLSTQVCNCFCATPKNNFAAGE